MLNTVPFVCIRTTTTNARKKTRKISFIRRNLFIVVFKQQNRVHNRGWSFKIAQQYEKKLNLNGFILMANGGFGYAHSHYIQIEMRYAQA